MAEKIASPVELQLLALVGAEVSGPEVAALYRRRTGRRISRGTLYTSLRRLRGRGWVGMRLDPDADRRTRLFRATPEGTGALAEAREHYRGLAGFALEPATA